MNHRFLILIGSWMLVHRLVANRFPTLLNMIFKFCGHKVLLNNYTFSFNDCITLIRLLCISIYFSRVDNIVSRFYTLIYFLILLVVGDHINIYRLFVNASDVLILTLISRINPTYSINTSTTYSILISFLVLN